MSFDAGQDKNASNGASARTRQTTPRDEQRREQANFGDTFSFFSLGELGQAPMGRTAAGEVLSKLNTALAQIYSSENKHYSVKLLPLDMQHNPDLPISVLVVTATNEESKKIGVGAYALILEGSAEPFASKYDVMGGENVEIKRFAGDAYDDNMRRIIEKAAADHWPNMNIVNCDAVVVPRGVNIEEKDVLYSIASGALYAIHTTLRSLNPASPNLNLKQARGDTTLQVQMSFGNPNTANAVGMPVRSDVQISTVAARNGTQGLTDRQSLIAKAIGYFDVVWNPIQQQQQHFFGQQQGPVATQKFMPHFIITALDCPALTTIEAQLFALATVPVLAEGYAWAKGFDRKVGGQMIGGVDVSDIGVLGIEANLENSPTRWGARIDVKSDQYRGDAFYRLLGVLFRPDLLVSMDIDDIGPDTWLKAPFLSAARTPRGANALLEAADRLTGGEFGKLYMQKYQGTGRPVQLTGDMIHLGYVEDNNGRRDIREVDHLCVSNVLGDRDPDQIITWSDSFFATNIPAEKRVSDRAKIIGYCEGGNVVFTGKAHRCTFEPAFLMALCESIAAAGTTLKQQITDVGFGISDRAVGLNGYGLNGAATGLYRHGYNNVGSNGFGNFGSRFG